jgi:RNA polymerase sigma-70 factor (ECF subfamily)
MDSVPVALPGDAAGAHADDAKRLRAAASGDPRAVRWLLDEVAPTVFGFLYARVGGDRPVAEDLLQETLLEVVRCAADFRGDAAVTTWMCAIARRRLARHYEHERKTAVAESRLRLVVPEQPEGEELERRDEVTRALGRLPALHRQVLVLKYLDEQTVQQIAEQLGRTAVQVQSLLQRARDGLRRELEVGRD